MLRTALHLALGSIASLLLISVLAFVIVASMPADPVMIAIRAWNLSPDPATVAALRLEWGLDLPIAERYLRWLVGFVAGDWGQSFRTGEPVLSEFASRLPLSFGLGVSGLALAVLLAIPIGFAAAFSPGGVADRLSRLLTIVTQAVPAFGLGLVLVWVLGVELKLLQPFSGGPAILVIAAALIALQLIGSFARVYRRELLAQSALPHFRTALAKGLGRREALWRHAHAAGLYAMLAALRAEAGWAIGSTATLEVLFGLPGVSQFLVASIAARDYAVLLAYIMTTAVWMTAMNSLAKLAMHRLDQRSR